MPKENLDWLPVVCEMVIRGEYCAQQLYRLIRDCQPEVAKLKAQRFVVHRGWLGLRLGRVRHDAALKTIDWSDAELEYLHLALHHLKRWEKEARHEDLLQARTRLQMADQAHRQYMKNRAKVIPDMGEDALAA